MLFPSKVKKNKSVPPAFRFGMGVSTAKFVIVVLSRIVIQTLTGIIRRIGGIFAATKVPTSGRFKMGQKSTVISNL